MGLSSRTFNSINPWVSNQWKSMIGKAIDKLISQLIKLVNWYIWLVSINQQSIDSHTKAGHWLLFDWDIKSNPGCWETKNRAANVVTNWYQSGNRLPWIINKQKVTQFLSINWTSIININQLIDIDWYWLVLFIINYQIHWLNTPGINWYQEKSNQITECKPVKTQFKGTSLRDLWINPWIICSNLSHSFFQE